MRETVVIFLHKYDMVHAWWVVLNVEASAVQVVQQGDPTQLGELAKDKEVIVVVPAEEVLLTQATLPKLSRARLLQALPYALEDQLTADIESLHFAPAEQVHAGELPVAIVAKEKMQLWFEVIKTWQIQPDRMLPSILALPYSATGWHVLVAETVLVRLNEYTGFVCESSNLGLLLELALTETKVAPTLIHLHNYTDQALAPLLKIPVSVKEEFIPAEQMFANLAREVVMRPVAINLLQAEFNVKKARFPQMRKMWKFAVGLAAAWVFTILCYPAISYFILAQRVHNLDTQIAQIYKRHFPKASGIVAPQLRMQEKLQQLSSQLGNNRFLLLLSYVGKSMQNANSIMIKHLDFQNNQISLQINAASSEDFASFTDYLIQQGFEVKQQNANLNGSRVSATVVVR